MSQPPVNPEIFEQRLREIEARIDTLQTSTRHDDIAVTLRQHFAEFRAVLNEARPVEEVAKIWRHDLESLEQRIGARVEKLANFEARSDRQGEADRRIDQLLKHLGELRALNDRRLAAIQQQIATTVADAIGNPAESIRRDVASLKEIQTSVDRRTRDTFEAVYGTIEEVVDRLAAIENELRLLRQPPAKTASLGQPAGPEPAPDPSSEAGANTRRAQAAPHAIDRIVVSEPPLPLAPTLTLPRERRAEGWGQAAESGDGAAETAEPVRARFVAAARRAAQAVVGEQPRTQARSPAPASALTLARLRRREGRGPGEGRQGEKSRKHAALSLPLGALFPRLRPRAKAAMVAVGMIALVLGLCGVAVDLFNAPAGEHSVWAASRIDDAAESDAGLTGSQPPPDQPPARPGANPDEQTLPAAINAKALTSETMPAQAPPHVVSPEMAVSRAISTSSASQTPARPAPYLSPQAAAGKEVTALTVRNAPPQAAPGRDPASQYASPAPPDLRETPLPPTIGSKALVAAASAGDPGACYEVAMRFAQGRNTTQDLAMAAAWLERAAEGGLAAAQFRLAVMYEKGLGVRKDLAEARRLFVAAAAKGHAKAMHNLAVLYAGGLDGKPDYALASQWFRRAAVHGVVDSQYNLAILYARGLGVERNFAESYKWFALAAKGGDKDAARKRDEVAIRLDPQELESARLNAESFVAVPQPDEATAVKAPAGGWDQVAAAATTKSKASVRPERFSGR
ncbi:MAG TPA: hypothetical protein VKT99_24125 [Xanthobacteraceae bacterium]|jgi:localization factor PodJL|nr:hypothetical protein [Xanthobacteraceae bacterium]